MKRTISVIIAVLLVTSLLPITSFAYKVGGPLLLEFENEPSGTEFIDLLVPIKQADSCYTDFNSKIELTTFKGEPMNITKDSEIALCNEDGFVSYCTHYSNAEYFANYVYEYDNGGKESLSGKRYYINYDEDIYKLYGTMKIAYLDKDGHILAVSNSVSVKGIPFMLDFSHLEANGTTLTAEKSVPPIAFAFLFFVVPPIIAITCIAIGNKVKKKKEITQN